MRTVTDADRAVSTTLGYVLTLAITTILVSGLLIAGGTFVESERERVVRAELGVVGERLAADVESADRLNRTTEPGGTAEIRVSLPDEVADSSYQVAVRNETAPGDVRNTYELALRADHLQVSVSKTIRIEGVLAETTVNGGNLVVAYRPASGKLEVSRV